ncbi:hypothetical protein [Streptomyces sp. NBC_00576]|uniref:hypothetical protein n=1 Tax=Streptomyces sp. NBC_00576 TaxID=2903665 RepID=UPI002E81FD69|nr:hypothetical protein [Streptomyces sp. NBC_00576]WUB69376.1 S1 family peptidase [Streptomyces sp. NBC_00576]
MRSKRRAGMLVGVLAAAAIPLAAPVSAWAAQPSAPAAGTASTGTAPTSQQWNKLTALAESQASVLGLSNGAKPVLSLAADVSAAQKAAVLKAIPQGVDVTVRMSGLTKDKVKRIEEAATGRKWHSDAQKYGVATTYDSATGKVALTTDAPRSALTKLLASYPGAVEVKQERFEAQNTRWADVSPFFGGSSITNGGGVCTSGFAVHDRTNPFKEHLLTAAHCFPFNNQVWNGSTHGPSLGVVEHKFNSIDTEMIGGKDYDKYIYTGGYTMSTSTHFIYGYHGATLNQQVCVSGQTTLVHCGHKITNNAFSVVWPNTGGIGPQHNSGFLYERGGTNNPCYCNGTLTQGGDSGAPIYVPDSTDSGAMIVGLHSGLIGTRMVGVKISNILNDTSSTLVT